MNYVPKHFKLDEFTISRTARDLGIMNMPSSRQQRCLYALIEHILDPLRSAYHYPIHITSGFRCPLLNDAVKGAVKSDHLTGCAADIKGRNGTKAANKELFDLAIKMMREQHLPIKQIIDEEDYSWIHISIDVTDSFFFSIANHPRNQILHILNGRKVFDSLSKL